MAAVGPLILFNFLFLCLLLWINPVTAFVTPLSGILFANNFHKCLWFIGFGKDGVVRGTFASFLSSRSAKYKIGIKLVGTLQSIGMTPCPFRSLLIGGLAGNAFLVVVKICIGLLASQNTLENDWFFSIVEWLASPSRGVVSNKTVVETVRTALQVYHEQ
ncbi:uncharacterized protein LOC131929068 [Physella acuta]|uniref:uncharacterized protein LOC131929068 n=1 Tax=Physella acuta TaxID=109671 RepID=UPI0027DE8960|nr:uncharacterized protein LOC131929068 [Physella acuta]